MAENKLIGSHSLPDTLNGDNNLDFMQNDLTEVLEDQWNEDRSIVYQHDGCPAHWRLTVSEYLNDVPSIPELTKAAPCIGPFARLTLHRSTFKSGDGSRCKFIT